MRHIKPFRVFYGLAILLVLVATGCNSQPNTSATPPPAATRDPQLEQTIEQQLATLNPAAIPVYREATAATDAGDDAKAQELYEKVLGMAPNFSTAYRRLGYIALRAGNVDLAIELSRKALELEPNGYNQSALALALLEKDTTQDAVEAYELAAAAVKALPEDDQALTAWLLAAAQTNNLIAMRQATEKMLQLQPNSPASHYFAGLVAAADGEWEKAEAELLYAQQLGAPADLIQPPLEGGIARNALLFRSFRWGIVALVSWLVGFGLLFLGGIGLSKATLRAVNTAQASAQTQIKPAERRIRAIYRVVVGLLSLYYYISIPFVILILLLVVGAIFYLFLLIGVIPIQIAAILVLMLLGSVFAIFGALFSRSKQTPPGRALSRMDAPELWQLVEEVARKLGIRPVDAIYLTPGIDIAVNEQGSLFKKMRGAGQRNLILGLGVLAGLTQGQLAAILAHEYGHFVNQDTAGGDLAYQVYGSLHQLAQKLVESRTAHNFNPVWLFVLAYQRIFLLVSQGASRLQEVLADRYAATTYGSTNFIEGLQSIVRQAIAFPLHANYEIRNAHSLNRPVINLYDLPAREHLSGELEKQFTEAMQRTTTDYDSHPSPQERITWIERLNLPYSPMHDNPQPALALFPNPAELQREMTTQVMRNLRASS